MAIIAGHKNKEELFPEDNFVMQVMEHGSDGVLLTSTWHRQKGLLTDHRG